MVFDDEELFIDEPLIELDELDAGLFMECAGLAGFFFTGLADMELLPDIEFLLDIELLPLMLLLLPDMVLVVLPAGVLCAKAGAAMKEAANRADTAALEIVFMVFFPFDGVDAAAGHPVARFGDTALYAAFRNMVQPFTAARIAPPLGA